MCTSTDAAGRYQLTVAQGTYYVFAKADEFLLERAYFTRAVACGLAVECRDHSKIPVQVGAGHILKGIDPADWFGPATEEAPRSPRV